MTNSSEMRSLTCRDSIAPSPSLIAHKVFNLVTLGHTLYKCGTRTELSRKDVRKDFLLP